MEREVGGGIGMGKTCKLKAVSFQCMTKFTTNLKKKLKNKQTNNNNNNKKNVEHPRTAQVCKPGSTYSIRITTRRFLLLSGAA